MIKKLSHVSLLTKDLNKIYKFYVEILGLKVIHKFVNNRKELYGLFLHAGKGTFIEFFKNNKKKLSKTYDHICFEVDNIYETKKKFDKVTKIEVKRGRTDQVLQFKVKDYENNIVEFHQYDKKSKLKDYLDE